MKSILRLSAAAAALCATLGACGGGGGGSGGGAPPAPPTLVAITLDPPSSAIAPLTVLVGNGVAVSCIGEYSDGSFAPVTATWSITGGTNIGLSPTSGSVTVVSSDADGPAQFEAASGALVAQGWIDVTEENPGDDPAPIYLSAPGEILEIPDYATGGAPAQVWDTPDANLAWGFTGDVTGTKLYAAVFGGSGRLVYEYEIATDTETLIVDLAASSSSLDYDSEGNLYTSVALGGVIHKINVLTKTSEVYSDVSVSSFDVAVGDTGVGEEVYFCPLSYGGVGAPWVYQALAGGGETIWATAQTAGPILSLPSGISVSGNAAFMTEATSNQMYRNLDLNADGDALDAGEGAIFATLPFAAGDGNVNIGLKARSQGRVVFWNCDSITDAGLYWIKDSNIDGAADDPGEVVLYSGTSVNNGRDGGVVSFAGK